MTVLVGLMFVATALVGVLIVYAYDLIERNTSKQGYPASVFRRRP